MTEGETSDPQCLITCDLCSGDKHYQLTPGLSVVRSQANKAFSLHFSLNLRTSHVLIHLLIILC